MDLGCNLTAATTFFVTYVITHTDPVRADDAASYAAPCDSWQALYKQHT